MAQAQRISRPAQSKLDTAIIVAVIGLVGTLVTALLSPIVEQWAQREFATPPAMVESFSGAAGGSQPDAAATAPPVQPTATLPPAALPTPTPDASLDCFGVEDWAAHTTDTNLPVVVSDGCFDLTGWGISMNDSAISILRYGTRRGEWYGVSQPVAKDVAIVFSLSVKKVQKGELWFGISEGASPTAKGVYLVRQENGVFEVRVCASDSCRAEVADITLLDDNGQYEIRFELTGNRLNININDGVWYRNDIQVSFSTRRLYIGLVPFSNAYLNAELSGLAIQEK